jgi:hypothetical protein
VCLCLGTNVTTYRKDETKARKYAYGDLAECGPQLQDLRD